MLGAPQPSAGRTLAEKTAMFSSTSSSRSLRSRVYSFCKLANLGASGDRSAPARIAAASVVHYAIAPLFDEIERSAAAVEVIELVAAKWPRPLGELRKAWPCERGEQLPAQRRQLQAELAANEMRVALRKINNARILAPNIPANVSEVVSNAAIATMRAIEAFDGLAELARRDEQVSS